MPQVDIYPEASGDFADYVDEESRHVREWRDGRKPAVEIRQGPEGFDPPFGSGDVLQKVTETESGIPVYALSQEHLQWVRRQVFKVRLELDLVPEVND